MVPNVLPKSPKASPIKGSPEKPAKLINNYMLAQELITDMAGYDMTVPLTRKQFSENAARIAKE